MVTIKNFQAPKWTNEEVEQMCIYLKYHKSVKEISTLMNRSYSAIKQKIRRYKNLDIRHAPKQLVKQIVWVKRHC